MAKLPIPESTLADEPKLDMPTTSSRAVNVDPNSPANSDGASATKTDSEAKSSSRANKKITGETAGESKYIGCHAPAQLGAVVDLSVVHLKLGGFKTGNGELLAALIHKHLSSDPSPAKLDELRRAVESYRRDFS